MTKQTGIMGWVLCLLSGALLSWGLSHASPGTSAHFNNPLQWDDSAAAIPVTSKDPMWGSRFAPVTIVVFSDYQCPHCKKIEDTYASLKERYGGDKLRIIWKNNPLAMHPGARPASEAGAVIMNIAGNDVFWRYHELVFGNPKAIDADQIVAWAVEAGVDKQKFIEAQATSIGPDKVKEDLAIGAKGGVRGTPAAFINGLFKSGNLPESEFVKIIDAELAATADMVREGVPADQIYVKRSLANRPNKVDVPGATTPEEKKPEEKKQGDAAPPAPTEAPGEDKDTAEEATEAALAKKEKPSEIVHKIPVEGSPVRGPADALVTIVELGDLSCPFTAAAEPALLEAMKQYDGKLRIVWKHHPMKANARSMPAELFAIEGQSQKGAQEFWAIHDKLLASKSFDDAALLAIAAERSLDAERVKALLTDANPSSPAFDPPLAATAASAVIARDRALAGS
ncbi:MAG: thioredoxin domain-containing protein, partial [Myxococcales bacterium]|nr:thioredoxin domain-containing protein [Myxococcales bacterium]